MFSFDELDIPILVAPMAGGPSTPELVAAVANAGGSGFLAVGGGMQASDLGSMLEATRSLTDRPFGVNLFVPDEDKPDPRELEAYREALMPEADRYGIDAPGAELTVKSYWTEDIECLIEHPVVFVSFTFGIPPRDEILRLREAGSLVIITVTNEDEARNAVAAGADALCVQGPEAGGHRSTHRLRDVPDARDLLVLLRAVRDVVDVPLVATGGITRPEQMAQLLNNGASAVQIGTMFLRSPECGANPVYKEALASGAYHKTRPTRAFSGRLARGLLNRFVASHHDAAPMAYPELNQLTGPIRKAAAAAGDPDGMSLWAGTGFRDAQEAPAGDIARKLWEDVAATE